jgi:hypothetical protein
MPRCRLQSDLTFTSFNFYDFSTPLQKLFGERFLEFDPPILILYNPSSVIALLSFSLYRLSTFQE